MRLLFTSTLFALLLVLGTRGEALASVQGMERCIEEPMSLAFQVAEMEAARFLSARSLVSSDEPVTPLDPAASDSANSDTGASVTAAALVRAATIPPTPDPARACRTGREPGCRVSSTPAQPGSLSELAHAPALLPVPGVHAFVLAAQPPVDVFVPRPRALGAPRDGVRAPPFRPPIV